MKRRIRSRQAGQTLIEYMLMVFVIIVGVLSVFALFEEKEFFFKRLTSPMVGFIKYNYKYGLPDALGWDEGSPKKHIQIQRPNPSGTNFRLFFPARLP